eukprot:16451779-Heterocapsa_arctica.AAC.1
MDVAVALPQDPAQQPRQHLQQEHGCPALVLDQLDSGAQSPGHVQRLPTTPRRAWQRYPHDRVELVLRALLQLLGEPVDVLPLGHVMFRQPKTHRIYTVPHTPR